MIRHSPLLPVAFLLAAMPAHAAGLPDTGQDTCYNDTNADSTAASGPASIARDGGTHPRQDCRYGRDPAAAASAQPKTGAGAKGFDYTKIANNGTALAATATLGTAATDWACTRDNITGLTWEVKTATVTDLRYTAHTYTWYNSNGNTNGGNAGGAGTNTCRATLPGSQCNTQAFVAAVNATALCSYADWRLPSLRELRTLNHFGRFAPSLDITYFPNTRDYGHWSSTHIAETYATTAWVVGSNVGGTFGGNKTDDYDVRLVRGGPF
ncbi:MAG: DUF1566 domain-containing protein [Betaproteobacteria bacterium]|nr:DUF1566 domain-containing protein [Betaproteobacteria bacterium]